MPTYTYRCTKCSHSLEHLQKITAEPLTLCPKCGEQALQRGPGGGVGLQFQGSGFYITDYKDSKPNVCRVGEGKSGCCPCSKE